MSIKNATPAWIQLGTYLFNSIVITALMFSADGDIRTDHGWTVDDIIMFLILSLLLMGGQLGVSQILGTNIKGPVRTILSTVGGVLGVLTLYGMLYTGLYWIKF